MPRIACGSCGGVHQSVAEVRACHEGRPPANAPAPAPGLREQAPPTGAGVLRPILGRSVVVAPDQPAPEGWVGCARMSAGGALAELEAAWRSRTPLIIEAEGDVPAGESETRAPWQLTPDFSFDGERRAHAVFANAIDARGPAPAWRWADEAIALGATADASAAADVILPGGRRVIVDGGPLRWEAASDKAAVVHRSTIAAGSVEPFGSNDTEADLAADQRAAVTHPGGAARIIAPAGSGKTRVLTERARHVLRSWHVPGHAVTLVAFNKRAADEMVERTADLPDLQIRTLNALGLSLVNRHTRVQTIEERSVRELLGSIVDLPRRANTDPAAAWIEALSAVRLGLQDPDEVEAEFGGDVDGLAEVLDRYRAILADRRIVDFDEQVYRAVEILLRDPAAREEARRGCRLLLVDEFQDLTPAHLLMIRLLAGPDGAVFGVGDDDQTIYGYSGASPRWLIDYERYFPSAGQHPLEVNYRCPPQVVDAARILLTHNRTRVRKTITAAPSKGSPSGGDGLSGAPPVEPLRVLRGADPLATTVSEVASLTIGAALPPSSVAVFTRVNASLAPVQVALAHRGVPVRKAVDESYLSRGGVQAALAWLRLATTGARRLSGADVGAAARRPSRGISPKLAGWMAEQSSLPELQGLAGRLSRDSDTHKVLAFVADVEAVQGAALSGETVDVLRLVRDQLGLDQAMLMLEGARRRLDRSAQTDDLDALVALAALHRDPHGFEAWLTAALRAPGDESGVTLATIHSVKGREWPHVVVHDVSSGLLPHRLAEDVEEERRLFHVAITRCSASVAVVGGSVPSPFLGELVEEWTQDRAPVRAPTRAGVGGGAEARRRSTASPATDAGVVAALKEWRTARSKADGKPAYVYLTDATIDAIAAAMPTSLQGLARVKGIGPAKLDTYGEELLALVERSRSAPA